MEPFAVLPHPPHPRNDTNTVKSSELDDLSGLEAAREQVNRILASDTLRASESVRRLLRFLANKTFSGEAEQLKEYSIGVDALGKPSTYDPRQDAGVRLLTSRVRLKLDEYYRKEGRDAPVTIELPRGRFKIVWKPRMGDSLPAGEAGYVTAPLMAPSLPVQTSLATGSSSLDRWRKIAIGLALVSVALTMVALWALRRAPQTFANSTVSRSTRELDALWNPLISSRNHLIIAFWNPLFVRFQGNGGPDVFYRMREVNRWDDVAGSPEFSVLRRLLGNPKAKSDLTFTMRGSLVSIFALSQFFASRRSDMSVVRLDELSWQQVADNDLLLVAPFSQISERQSALPVSPEFVVEKNLIRVLRPRPGEPSIYADVEGHQDGDGETVELVSMMPGPLGRTRVVSFAGSQQSGLIGSVRALTDPAFARVLVQKLRRTSGRLPPYFQVVIKIRYRDDTPTYTTYLTHRELNLPQATGDN